MYILNFNWGSQPVGCEPLRGRRGSRRIGWGHDALLERNGLGKHFFIAYCFESVFYYLIPVLLHGSAGESGEGTKGYFLVRLLVKNKCL